MGRVYQNGESIPPGLGMLREAGPQQPPVEPTPLLTVKNVFILKRFQKHLLKFEH